jgi:hypothetical protein
MERPVCPMLLKLASPISFSAEALFLLHTSFLSLSPIRFLFHSFILFTLYSLIIFLFLSHWTDHWKAGCHAASNCTCFVLSMIFPMGCKFTHFSKLDLGTILSLVTLSHHTSLAIFSLAFSPVIQAVSHGQLWQQTRSLPLKTSAGRGA